MHDEDYIAIDMWNDQAGCWENLDEAKTVEEARETIEKLRNECYSYNGYYYNYAILQVKREVIKA